ncbi:LytR/AlgR family response regulator transcription factor [Flectobacillus roseus]|uniref:LytR/AlgR family response regulator transcription factor n=1 Tax=Flectobacillus roseus TaxID=502259 RepID=UPI0024B6D66A|nr:LytTR family DNA-binding domain-containing protein [Flectobacillus roseus]MDI9872620.1 LytTR family DNA-binding domain-containing protein [Flectobacillus roseus]
MKARTFERHQIKILLIEDESGRASSIEPILIRYGFSSSILDDNIINFSSLIETYDPNLMIIIFFEKNTFNILLEDRFLNLPILVILNELGQEVFDIGNKHPRSLFLIEPIDEHTLLSSLNLLLSRKLYGFLEVIDSKQHRIKLNFDKILLIEADGNYTRTITTDKVYVRKITLKNVKNELDSSFVQINKSQIINIDFIDKLDLANGVVILKGKKLKISKVFKANLDFTLL